MPSCTIDPIAQISDSGITGKVPYTGNYPLLILDTLRRPFGCGGLSLEALGACIGCHYDGRWHDDQESEVLDALEHLRDLGLVTRSRELWFAKKVRI